MQVKYNEFRQDNTEGYSDDELDQLNIEWTNYADTVSLHPADDDYDRLLKAFADQRIVNNW